MITIAEILKATSGRLISGTLNRRAAGFSIDTRTLKPGDFFVPLQGERQDGHQYIHAAFEKGASGAFLAAGRQASFAPAGTGSVVLVENVLAALQSTAAYHRGRFTPVMVAVTGSAGKTTTKDYIASVLEGKFTLLKTEGNLNNEIGLPLMLLKLGDQHQAAVLEIGMSGFGEIAALTRLARPSIGVITNIGEAHLEMVGSLEGVTRAKGELLEEMGPGGRAVLNGEDLRLQKMGRDFAGETVFYGFRKEYPVRGEILQTRKKGSDFEMILPRGRAKVALPQAGAHNVLNALAAAAVGHLMGLGPEEIKGGLEKAKVTLGRMQVEERAGMTVINDTYNANPTSVRASLEALAQMAGAHPRGALLGDMFELGEEAKASHEEVGRYGTRLGLDYLITLGSLSLHTARGAQQEGLERVRACLDRGEALKALKTLAKPGDFLLVKGSRGMGMEKIVASIEGEFFIREDVEE